MSWHAVALLLLLLLYVGMFWNFDLPSPKGKKSNELGKEKDFSEWFSSNKKCDI